MEEVVTERRRWGGPAETWARHFPKLRRLSLASNPHGEYLPTRLDLISETACITNVTELDVEGCHITREVVWKPTSSALSRDRF